MQEPAPTSAEDSSAARRNDEEGGPPRPEAAADDGSALAAAAPTPQILPVQRIGAAIEVILCSGFPTQLLLIAILTGFGMPIRLDEGRLSPSFVFLLSLLDTVFVVGLVFFFIRAHRESAAAMFLGGRPIVREMLMGVIILPILFLIVLIVRLAVLTLAPQLHNVERNPFEDMLQTRYDTLAFGVVVMVAGGVREEIQRAFVLRRFQQFIGGAVMGVVVFSALFGLGHIEQGFDAALATALLGAAWGTLYLLRGSIVAPMVSHAAFNLAQLITSVTIVVR